VKRFFKQLFNDYPINLSLAFTIMDLNTIFDSPSPPPDWTYSYTDGNNNTYYITPHQVVYYPISPLQSSSGLYSGGKAAQKEITDKDYAALLTLIAKISQTPTDHQEERIKFASILHYRALNKTTILKHKATTTIQLESLLQKTIS
jgi:hypothetical protein